MCSHCGEEVIRSERLGYLPTIDGWRAVAILLVVFCHLTLPWSWFSELHDYGKLGVDLFFGISGLLITSRLISEHEATSRICLKKFYLRRAFRILPAAFAYLMVVALLTAAGVFRVHPVDLLAGVFFFANYVHPTLPYFWYVGHFWSLSVEEHFYILWPGSLRVVGVRFGMVLSVGLAVAFAAWRMMDSHYHWVSASWLVGNSARSDYRADALLWGCAAAFALQSRVIKNLLSRLLPVFWPGLGVVAIGLLSVFHPRGYIPLIALVVPTLIVYTLLHPARITGKLLETPILRRIGRLSYSLYLWQQLFLTSHEWLPRPSVFQRVPLNIALVLVFAYLSYRFVERPCIAFGNRMIDGISREKSIRAVAGEPALEVVPG